MMDKTRRKELDERYDRILRETANRTINGNFSRSKHMTDLLRTIWPDREFGFYNDSDLPLMLSDRGGAWNGLSPEDWTEYEEWNDMVAHRHGITVSQGILKMGIHNICWRPRDFGKRLRYLEQEKNEARLKGTVKQQENVANMALGCNVADMRMDEDNFEQAKAAPEPIHTDPEALAAHEPRLQVTVPEMPKKTVQKKPVKRGRPAKVAPKVDKPAETA